MAKKKDLNRIKTALQEGSIAQNKLAYDLKVDASTVFRWCSNLAQPSIQDLFRIADYLHVDVRDLLVPNKNSNRLSNEK